MSMKRIRLRTVFIYTLAALCGALLLHTSQNVQQTEAELAAITGDVNREKESIRVLKTEWAYLNSPERLERLAKKFLNLSPPDPSQIKTDGLDIPAKAVPPLMEEEPSMQAQPVSLTPPPQPSASAPPQKPSPPATLKAPQEKTLDQLLKEVAEEGAE
jgi:cell division protein FtsL